MNKTNKRGQAALEFLLTYGWALGIVAIGLVIAWSSGLLNMGGQIKSGQSGFYGVVPHEFKYGSGEFVVELKNEQDTSINITYIQVEVKGKKYDSASGSPLQTLKKGEKRKFSFSNVKAIGSGSPFYVNLMINYTDPRLSKTFSSCGEVWGTTEK